LIMDQPCRRLSMIIGTALLGIALAGCTGEVEPGASSPAPSSPQASYPEVSGGVETAGIPGASASADSPSPSAGSAGDPAATAGSAPASSIPTMGTAPEDATEVAKKYIGYRENAMSWDQETPRSWLAQAKPLMTDDGYADVSEGYSDEGSAGYAWSLSHESGYAVKVAVECQVPSAAGSTEDAVTLQCAVTDQVVDKSGKPLPITKIPTAWPYAGPQQPALLSMVRDGGDWLIDDDLTGEAG
jgi:hypothetical protein